MKSTSPSTTRRKIAKRYAAALFGCAQDKKSVEPIYEELMTILQGIEQSEEFSYFWQNPAIAFRKFKTVIESLFKNKMDPLTWQFFEFLRQHDRLDLLKEVCSEFEKLYLEHKKILKVKVISARELKSEQLEAIVSRLKSRFAKEIRYELEVNPRLIGGFKIQIGGVIHDYSVEYQLDKFKKRILSS